MKKTLLLAFQVFLLIQFSISDDDFCTSQFEDVKSSLCAQLSNDEQTCVLVDNECQNWYKRCIDYKPESNFDENVCKRIQPSNTFMKCTVETASDGKKSCVQTDKVCSDFTDETCAKSYLGTEKRCVFINGKCEEHINSCEGLDKSTCSKNIPRTNTQKCIWKDDTTGCVSEPRKCDDYIVYLDNNDNSLKCGLHQITTGTSNRICVLYEDKCMELYESCDKAGTEEACKNTLPLKKNSKDENEVDEGYKCVWDGECKKEPRLCSEYKKELNSYIPANCGNLTPQNEHSLCFLDKEKDKCEEVADSCENYNSIVEAENDRTEEGCKSSLSEDGFKCVFENKRCSTVIKECKDFSSKNECLVYNTRKDGKKCVFQNNLCKEEYEDCETYNNLVSEANRKKEDCESIYSFKKNYKRYKCVFSDSKTCESYEVKKCSDYTGSDADECGLYPTEVQNHVCVYENNKCEDKINFVYSYCFDYKGNDKSICEAIQPRYLNNYLTLDPTKKCVLEEEEGTLTCVEKTKECSDAKDARECMGLRLSKQKKRCVYKQNKCIEQYQSCGDYQISEDVLDKETCESIVPFDGISKNANTTKCVFTEGDGGNKGTCKTVSKACSDFNVGEMYDKCLNLKSYFSKNYLLDNYDVTECAFSNNACKTEIKSCLGLSFSSDATEENCKNAKTSSSNLKCDFLAKDENGRKCVEVNNKESQLSYVEEKEEEDSSTEQTETNAKTDGNAAPDDDDNEYENSNNAREKYLNKIFLILLAALL